MTDYTELKRLANHAIGLDDSAYTPCQVAFQRAANPHAVLALIAENERVKARLCVCRDCGGQGEVYSGHSSYQGHNQPPEPDMDVCGTCGGDGVLGPLEDFEALADERDQLKAENERLESEAVYAAAGFDAAREEVAQLKAENEELRMDVDRLQSATAFVQKLCGAAVKQPSVATGYLHDILSAMGKEEQS